MEVEAGVTPENELEDEIPSADPGNVPNIEAPRMRIIVCQASYGDTFGIEIDQEPPNSYSHVDRVTNGSRQFMLIDGGPATVRPTGTVGGERIPLQNMYRMLSDLVPVGSPGLDTLVVTQDDADHMFGIAHLLKLLNLGEPSGLWLQGTTEVTHNRAPFARVWHNSAETIFKNFRLELKASAEGKNRDKQQAPKKTSDDSIKTKPSKSPNKGKGKKHDGSARSDASESDDDISNPGYFDKALRDLARHISDDSIPTFNAEFQNADKLPEHEGLVVADGLTPTAARGHVTFNILGPRPSELKGLANFFTQNRKRRSRVGDVSEDEIMKGFTSKKHGNKLNKLGDDLKRKLTNDASAKNVSSIVFETVVLDPERMWSGLFTGDASACNIFRDWDGNPKNYDLIKIFGDRLMGRAKSPEAQNPPTEDMVWKPSEHPLGEIFSAKVTQAIKKGSISLSNVRLQRIPKSITSVCSGLFLQISASNDQHPNPHLSTLVGIIARAVFFPATDGQPVRIYLTNPIADGAWESLLTYWLEVAEYEHNPNMASATTKSQLQGGGLWEFDGERDLPKLSALLEPCTVEKLNGTCSSKAIFGLIANIADENPLFEIYYLKASRSYGVLRADPPQLDLREVENAEHEHNIHWERILVQDAMTKAKIAESWMAHFSTLKYGPALPTAIEGYKLGARMNEHRQTVIRAIPHRTGAPPNRMQSQDPPSWCGDLNSRIGSMYTSKSEGTEESETVNSCAAYDIKLDASFSATTASQIVPPILNTTTKVTLQHTFGVSAPTLVLESSGIQGQPAATQTPTAEKFPIASEPNIEAFRKFDVDEFDIPPGDNFVAMAQMKIVNIQSYAELLAYLAENNKLTTEDAIKAGTVGGVDGYAKLGALIYLTVGIDAASLVLGTLPLESPSVLLLTDQVRNPMLWPVQLLNASVLDTSILAKYYEGVSGIQQLAIRIFPQTHQTEYVWAVPNKAALLGKGEFCITVKSCIDVTVFWPTDPKRRIVHGRFCGKLPTSEGKTHNVVCEWLIMPDESRPVVYHVQFANAEFVTAGHEMSIPEMLSPFDGVSVDLDLGFVDAVLPGLVDLETPLGSNIKFTEPGFTMSRNFRHSQSLELRGVFGKFSVEGVDSWKPFGENAGKPGLEGFIGQIQIPMPSIRLCLGDFFDAKGPRAFFRIIHSIQMGNSDLAYELGTREARHGERLLEFTFRPVTVDAHQPLTLMQLLATFGLDALREEDVPKFIMDALNGISLTCFRLGWAGELSLRLPDYIEIGVRVERLSIASDLLNLDNIHVRLRIDHPLKKEKRNVYLQSGGIFRLAGVEAQGRLNYGIHPLYAAVARRDDSAIGPVELSIGATDSPLTLGKILNHFWPGNDFIPKPFSEITDEAGLTQFVLRMGYSEVQEKQVVKLVKLGLGITSTQVEIMEGLSLIEPTLEFTAYNPFDQASRMCMINLGAMVLIDDYNVSVSVGVAAGESAAFAVAMSAGGGGLPVGTLVRFAQRNMKSGTLSKNQTFSIDYPENSGLGVLDETEILDFTFVVAKGENGKYGIDEFSVHASSDLHLDIWHSVKLRLERITLQAGYGSETGFAFTFGSEFYIGKHILQATMGYDTLPRGGFADAAGAEKCWFIQAEYADEIDLLAIAKRLMGTEMADSINGTKIERLKTDKDSGVAISNLAVALQYANSGGSIYISADTEWAVFKRVELAATYSGTSSWGFCLHMALRGNLLLLVPIDCIQTFSEWIEVNDATVALYVGKVNTAKAGLTKVPPRPGSKSVAPSSSVQTGLAVSATIKLTKKFGVISNWVAEGELELEGHISTQSIGMSAKIPTKVQLGNKDEKTGIYDFEINTGSFGFDIEKGAIKLGLYATIQMSCPTVTEDIINVQNAGLIINSAGGIGLEGRVDGPLRNLFGLEGLEARGLSVTGVFSLVQSGLPEQLGLSGGIRLAETKSSGEIAFYFAQRDLTNCYFCGRLENIDIGALINFGLKRQGLPQVAEQFLNGNVVIHNLQLEAALDDIEVTQLQKSIKRGFYYEARLWIKAGSYEWAGYACVELRAEALQLIAMMSPISFSNETQSFFRLTRGSKVPPDVILPEKHPELHKDGPVIYISSRNPATWLCISTHLVLLSVDFELTAQGDSSGFELEVPSADLHLNLTPIDVPGAVSASLRGKAHIKPQEQVRAELKIDLAINFELPMVTFKGLKDLNITLPSNQVAASFNLDFNFSIGWPGSGSEDFNLHFSAEVHALGQRFELAKVAVNLHPRDIDTVEKVASAAVREFLREYPTLLRGIVAFQELAQTAEFLKTKFDQAGMVLLLTLSVLKEKNPEDVVDSLGREAFDLVGPEAGKALVGVLTQVHGASLALRIATTRFADMLPSFSHMGVVRIPFTRTPLVFSVPRFIPNFVWSGLQKGPDVVAAPRSSTRVYRVDDNGNEIPEKTLTAPQAETEQESPSQRVAADDERDSSFAEGAAANALDLGGDDDVMEQAPAPEPVLRVEIVRAGQDVGVEEWTQEQVAACVRAQRIALIRFSLEVFPPEQAFESARDLFADLSYEQLTEYFKEAYWENVKERRSEIKESVV
ncbi:hypothetical protein QBC42DRAFT_318159 [Cladorrhinum samala]|uniref:Uncharacterized protein n=1 Tax=Cladorrhinum samala TaxID=585594 RepID=A0AAV9HY81_9PEZI|nr:hypothetical protein QBC42DRAFT_318159 [Cladorrhinum samala]